MTSFFSKQSTKCYHCYLEKQKDLKPTGRVGTEIIVLLTVRQNKGSKSPTTLTNQKLLTLL